MSLRLAVLASGRGSNLGAMLDACRDGRIDGTIVGVFSDKPASGAIAMAHEAGVHAWTMKPNAFETRDAFDAAMFDAVDAVQPDLIVCAGYMRIIGAAAIARFPHRMLNIHPSLLPRHPGLHTHQRALDAGDTEHGASVHVVIPELDAGPVLAQVRVPVQADDSAETLAKRVLAREHPLLLASVAAIATAELSVDAGVLRWQGAPLGAPLQLGDDDRLRAHARTAP
jgi:phosphoribosylglycinamide formyltransferase-1